MAVEKIHFDKGLGISEISPDVALDFCRRNFPDRYDMFLKDIAAHPETLYLDFENVWTGIESTPAYTTLLEVIKKQRIQTAQNKANISCLIALHNIRSHSILRSSLELAETSGLWRFEYYWKLKHQLSDPDFLLKLAGPTSFSQWIVYSTDSHTFPLPDSPILVENQTMMVALSPRMLLEVNLRVHTDEYSWIEKNRIPNSKLKEFRRRCISNTFKEIIFHDMHTLEVWRETPEFKRRVKLLSTQQSYNAIVAKYGNRELWKINAFGNHL